MSLGVAERVVVTVVLFGIFTSPMLEQNPSKSARGAYAKGAAVLANEAHSPTALSNMFGDQAADE